MKTVEEIVNSMAKKNEAVFAKGTQLSEAKSIQGLRAVFDEVSKNFFLNSFLFLYLTIILFYSNACYNQLHKPKLLMKQYIWYKYREVSYIIILEYFIIKYLTNYSVFFLKMNFSELLFSDVCKM